MTIDDITKNAKDRLAALDAEAAPIEATLKKINDERDRLRLVVAAGDGQKLYAVQPARAPNSITVGPAPLLPGVTWTAEETRYVPSIDSGTTLTICGGLSLPKGTDVPLA